MLTQQLLERYIRRRNPFLFHLSDAENVESILVRGITARGGESNFDQRLTRPGHIYLCNRITALRAMNGHFDCSWGDAVFRVDVRKLEIARFNSDEEYWRGYEFRDGSVVAPDWRSLKKAFSKMDEPAQVYSCLVQFGSVAYKGKIRPDLVELCWIGARPDLPWLKRLVPVKARF
jgi:hypothetical protein